MEHGQTRLQRLRSRWSAVRVPADPPVTVLLPEPLRSAVVRLRDDGRSVDAVRLVRERTGLGLLPAHKAVQAAQPELAEPDER